MASYSRRSRSRRSAAGTGGKVRGYTLRDRKGRVRYVGVSGDPRRSRRKTAGKGGAVQGYSLRDRKGQPTYFGVTNDPSRRAAEHKQDGKRGKLNVETRPMSRAYARRWEAQKLARHRKTHRGKNPVHNKTRSGGWKS